MLVPAKVNLGKNVFFYRLKPKRRALPSVTATEPAFALQSSFAIGVERSEGPFRGFLPRKTTPRDLYQATVIAKTALVDVELLRMQSGVAFDDDRLAAHLFQLI